MNLKYFDWKNCQQFIPQLAIRLASCTHCFPLLPVYTILAYICAKILVIYKCEQYFLSYQILSKLNKLQKRHCPALDHGGGQFFCQASQLINLGKVCLIMFFDTEAC